MNKICTKCEIKKELTEFPKDKNKKDGYTSSCKQCKKEYRDYNRELISLIGKRYRDENRDSELIRQSNYRQENRESIRQKDKERYRLNPEKSKEYHALWLMSNKDSVKKYNRIYNRIYKKLRSEKDPLFKLSLSIRDLIRQSINSKGFSKKSKTSVILGCSFEEFRLYIESKFETWMNWQNRGLYNGELNYGWDLDHIIPISSAKSENELIKLNHYLNFQPLCSKMNRYIKKDKYLCQN
jgi:hypothetical protein